MKIVIDLQSCQSGSRLGGIGRYSLGLAKGMVRQAGKHDIWLLLNNNLPDPIPSIREEFIDLLPQNRIITFESIDRVNEFYTRGSFRTRAAELVREDFIARLNPDFVFLASLFEGLGDDVVTSIGNIAGSHFTAVSLYDLIPFVHSDIYLTGEIQNAHYMRKLVSLKRSDLLLAISQFSRDEGRRLLDFPAQRTINISSAISDYFKPLVLSKTERDKIRAKFNIRNKFLMYTSSYDPRKNQAILIEAFALLPRHLYKDFQLVLVGNGWEDVYNSLRSHMRSNGLKESDVIFTGYIDDDTLLKLYNMCHLFVFPSLFEGFGIPILEAMSCGTPAIGSNSTSIPEVIGRDDALFDPASARSIASKISEVLRDGNFYESLCQHAVAHSKKFSWDNSAKKAIEAMENFISSSPQSTRIASASPQDTSEIDSGRRAQLISQLARIPGAESENDGTLLELSVAIASNEYFLDVTKAPENQKRHTKDQEYVGVVTTWNTKCSIAAYAKHLMSKFIGKYCIFAPYTDDLIDPDENFVSRCWNSGLIIDPDSFSDLAMEIDNKKVTSVLIQFNHDLFDFDVLSNLIDSQLQSNRSVYVEIHCAIDILEPCLNKQLIKLVPSLRRCNKLLVHSYNDVVKLLSLGISDNVVLFPQGVLDINTIGPGRRERGKDIVIATYGYFLPHKGFLEMIAAFAKLFRNNSHMKLLMVGAECPGTESKPLIEKAQQLIMDLGLSDKVTLITDYLAESQCLEYLAQADLIVYPYQCADRSASSAVRFGLASKVPVAVTPLRIFNDVTGCVHYLPGTNVIDMVAGIDTILHDIKMAGPNINSIKDSCDRWLKSHKFESMATYLYSIVSSDRAFNREYRLAQYFSPGDGSLQTIIGKLNGSSISSGGKEGVLLYGPYRTLTPGLYHIRCFGNVVSTASEDSYEVILFHSHGGHIIHSDDVEIDDNANGLLFIKQFYIDRKVDNFEVQILAKNNHNLTIDGYIISRNRVKH